MKQMKTGESVMAINKTNNPYVLGSEGKKIWNDRYMNMAKSIKNWQIAALSALITSIILAFVVLKLALSSHVQPFMVETNQGMPYAIKPLSSISIHDEKLINFAANEFIINARSVLSDNQAEKLLLTKVYAFAADNAISYLHDYYKANNPLNLSQQYTVDINIINSMPLSAHVWQVVWDETKRGQDGSVISKTRWIGNLTYQLGQVNPQFINENPFGLYITNVTWSESVGV